jgi:hypothetical protein
MVIGLWESTDRQHRDKQRRDNRHQTAEHEEAQVWSRDPDEAVLELQETTTPPKIRLSRSDASFTSETIVSCRFAVVYMVA